MKSTLFVSFILFIVLICTLSGSVMPSTTQDRSSQSIEALTEGSNKFAINLYQALSKSSDKNIIVSPLSVQLVLALAYIGAKGKTAEEIKTVLGLPGNQDDILNGHKALIQELNNPLLKLANKMFVDNSLQLNEQFQKLASDYFLSGAEKMNFVENAEEARVSINNWVEDKTNKKIQNLLQPGIIDSLTRLVLINAVHFKAKWLKKFDDEATTDEPFYVTPERSVNVPMMHIKDKFGYKSDDKLGATLLEMTYEGGDFRMVIILPNEKDGLARVESQLPSMNLVELLSNFRNETVNVALPRMKIEETMDLNDILTSMGMGTMFTGGADFSGISETERLAVSKVIQKAYIEVNEEGTEAAAATGAVFLLSSAPRPEFPKLFIADRPFAFSLLHRNKIIFIGSAKNLEN